MRRGIPKLFQNRGIHRRPLRFHGDAEKVARSNRIREQIAAPSPLAPPLEHESQQCQLSRPTCRGSVVFRRRSKTMSRPDRALHGQCKNSARGVRKNRAGRLWRHECALHLGKNAQRPNELANVRSNAVRNKCGRYTWRRIWRARRRLCPNIGLQQSRERRGSRAPTERAQVAAVDSLVPTGSPSRAFPSMSLGSRRLHSAEPPLRRNRISPCDLREARNIPLWGKKSAWPRKNKICFSSTASVF